MGGRIPEQIKSEAIRKWLLGARRDKIAGDLEIGEGTVSEIINQYSLKDSEVGLIRQVALAIKALQTNVLTFSQALRLKNILNERGLPENTNGRCPNMNSKRQITNSSTIKILHQSITMSCIGWLIAFSVSRVDMWTLLRPYVKGTLNLKKRKALEFYFNALFSARH
jgi:hypothetical protein